MMPAYNKYSPEELRLGDYNAGRRYNTGSGFSSGGAFGGFGSSTSNNPNTFGSGTTNNNLFGGGNNNTSSFSFGGNSNSASNAFGSKPTGTGIFGGSSTGASTTGGLFGTPNAAFGSNNTTGGNIFGGSNNNQQKPGGLFGNNTATTSAAPLGGFSTATNNSTNAFGGTNSNASGSGLFGQNTNNNSNNSQGGGLFGFNSNASANNNQQKPNLFGGPNTTTSGTSLFGNTSNAGGSGGLFGPTSTTNNNTGGIFGGNNNTTPGGGLFGQNISNQQPKPSLFGGNTAFGGNTNSASTAGLFGGNNTASNTSGGLFNSNANNNSGGSLFGGLNANNNAPKPGGLFGLSNNNSGGLFGGANSTNNNASSIFGSAPINQQQNQQQLNGNNLQASLLDGNPYGQSSIWSGLPAATPTNSGPLVTPLSASQRLKDSQSKPPLLVRLGSPSWRTPNRRTGFGFSYSTYGTPNSAASTPGGVGLSSSMYGKSFIGGSFGRSMGKSFSASNLRQQFVSDGESVLSPGAFAPGSSRYSSGSIRRLTIDKSLRTDLFARPALPAPPAQSATTNVQETNSEPAHPEPLQKLKKRVSFDKEATGGHHGELNGATGALVRTEADSPEPITEDQTSRRSGRRSLNGSAAPEMEQVRGKELAVVPEDRESEHAVSNASVTKPGSIVQDPRPGQYWQKPTQEEMKNIPRAELQQYKGFQIGRHNCGYITFDDPVDLTSVNLGNLEDQKYVEIKMREVTVYPDSATKPPVGKGLNVPSTICLENSWPRNKGKGAHITNGKKVDQHIARLQKMVGTTFKSYDNETGIWTFSVPHYTRYGFDDDDEDEILNQSTMNAAPEQSMMADESVDMDNSAYEKSELEDDTFGFKRRDIPGGFGRQSLTMGVRDQPFLGRRPPADDSGSDVSNMSADESSDHGAEMIGSFPTNQQFGARLFSPSKSILKSTQLPFDTPGKALLDLEDDWAAQLQKTISPRKQNRDALREMQSKVLLDLPADMSPLKPRKVQVNKVDFRTSIDVMNSLFGAHQERMANTNRNQDVMDENDLEV